MAARKIQGAPSEWLVMKMGKGMAMGMGMSGGWRAGKAENKT